jgi:hypothetical protein
MKKTLILSLLFLFCAVRCVHGQVYVDVVQMKNGNIIRGIIMEQVPYKSITIKSNSGEVFNLSYDDIVKISKEEKSSFKLGLEYQGGNIFFIDETGEHGLIAAPFDIECEVMWGRNCDAGATSTMDGQGNTKKIIYYFTNFKGINYLEETAAYRCDNFVCGGYDDWYLPAIDELEQLYINRKFVPGLEYGEHGDYCSSTEYGNKDSYNIHFRDRGAGSIKFYYNKNDTDYCIRCIRKF